MIKSLACKAALLNNNTLLLFSKADLICKSLQTKEP